MAKLNDIFQVSYGNKFDLNKMKSAENGNFVSFVSRTSKNLGVAAYVKEVEGVQPHPAGLITVALGGAVLSSFVQKDKFYTAQNIAVLTPRKKMNFVERVYYCKCIEMNKFKYSTFGREANRTLKELELPDSVPSWTQEVEVAIDEGISKPFREGNMNLKDRKWQVFPYDKLFTIKKGKRLTKHEQIAGGYPYVSSSSLNNGIDNYISNGFTDENCITFACYGSIGEVFYQKNKVWVSDNANAFYVKERNLNPYIALFLITIMKLEKFKFSYGVTGKMGRLNNFKIKLPVDENGNPDWKFMEDYIKSLLYSKSLEN